VPSSGVWGRSACSWGRSAVPSAGRVPRECPGAAAKGRVPASGVTRAECPQLRAECLPRAECRGVPGCRALKPPGAECLQLGSAGEVPAASVSRQQASGSNRAPPRLPDPSLPFFSPALHAPGPLTPLSWPRAAHSVGGPPWQNLRRWRKRACSPAKPIFARASALRTRRRPYPRTHTPRLKSFLGEDAGSYPELPPPWWGPRCGRLSTDVAFPAVQRQSLIRSSGVGGEPRARSLELWRAPP
jgi:hypothetical protein